MGASTCTYLFSNVLTKCVTLTPKIYSPMFHIDLYVHELPKMIFYVDMAKKLIN